MLHRCREPEGAAHGGCCKVSEMLECVPTEVRSHQMTYIRCGYSGLLNVRAKGSTESHFVPRGMLK